MENNPVSRTVVFDEDSGTAKITEYWDLKDPFVVVKIPQRWPWEVTGGK